MAKHRAVEPTTEEAPAPRIEDATPAAAATSTPMSPADVLEFLAPCLMAGESFDTVGDTLPGGEGVQLDVKRMELPDLGQGWRVRTSAARDLFLSEDGSIHLLSGIPMEATTESGGRLPHAPRAKWDADLGRFAFFAAHPTKSGIAVRVLVPNRPAGYDHSMRSYFVEKRDDLGQVERVKVQ